MALKKFNLNLNYKYADIEKWALDNHYSEYEYGEYYVGENFLVFKHPSKDKTISFMLIAQNDKGGVYQCIYTDL